MKHKETLPEQVRAFLQEQQMVQAGDTICCALSGGADSVCLLRCLLELAEPLHLTITAVHVNHQLRGAESERDAAFCEALCTRWNVPLHMVRCDVNAYAEQHHASIETAARACRYAAFSAIPANHIVTAHTASDNLETMLHRLIRGSGLRGLAGIPAVRERYIRPLLTVTRAEVEAYLQTLGQDYVTDSTNETDAYTRNQIRHQLIPVLKQLNPSLEQTSECCRCCGVSRIICGSRRNTVFNSIRPQPERFPVCWRNTLQCSSVVSFNCWSSSKFPIKQTGLLGYNAYCKRAENAT